MLAFVNMLPDTKNINISIIVTFPVSLQHQVSSLIPTQNGTLLYKNAFVLH